MKDLDVNSPSRSIRYFGGTVGAVLPFLVFVAGVVVIALSGAPDERSFWPVLILALHPGIVSGPRPQGIL